MHCIDCQKLPCPEPVILCKKYVIEHSPTVFNVLVDNLPAKENVSRFLENNGYSATVTQEQASLWKIEAQVQNGQVETVEQDTADLTEQAKSAESLLQAEKSSNVSKFKNIVFISTEFLGQGDDVLGEKLMESFVSCLKEMQLWQVILVNGGVKLSAREGKNLENLKELEAMGVTILVCGACLQHYKLYDDKKVGQTTNMLDIVTAMDLADKVIRP